MSKKKLAGQIGLTSVAILISRILGLVRDIVLMNFFGTTYVSDAFQAGFKIPNLLRKLFGEGALSAVFIPIYNEIGTKKSKKEQIDFGLNILSILSFFLLLLSILGMILTPLLVKLITPGFDEKTYVLTVKLTRVIFPYLFLIGFSSTLISILNSHEKFFIPGLSSAFLNIGMILAPITCVLFFAESTLEDRALALSFGVITGGILQTVVNFPILKQIGYRFKIILNLKSDYLKIVWQKFLPGVLGLAIRQVNLLVDTILASFLIVGSITALTMGNRLMQLPLGVFGISASIAVLPLFSKFVANDEWDKLNEHLNFSMVSLSLIMIPITAILIGLGKEFLQILFLRGQFDQNSLEMTYLALVYYTLGITFYSMNRLIIPVFYATKDTKTPVKISALIVVINIALNIIFMSFMQHAGLALATSVSAMIQFFILIKILKNRFSDIKLDFLNDLIKMIFLSVIIFLIIYFGKKNISLNTIFNIFLYCSVSVIIYVFGANFLKISSSDKIIKNIWKRFRKKSKKK
ncbi:MAG: murein biosynthesis integral membrane protein MurJ [Candidatus Cloacimonetes bacterium]|nr:murein biosynthesis integral membrane protein MurJ [Candidatus Cloacimonadota bacterium]